MSFENYTSWTPLFFNRKARYSLSEDVSWIDFSFKSEISELTVCRMELNLTCTVVIILKILLKSVNPKISRIGRQKQKNDFFLIWPKEPIWLPVFGNGIKRFDFLFFSSKFAKLENSATGPSAAAMRLEIWHMFNMLVWTYQTLS